MLTGRVKPSTDDIGAAAAGRRHVRRQVFGTSVGAARPPQPVDINVRHLAWKLRAACLDSDPELFFADEDVDLQPLRQMCLGCPVIAQCRDYADTNRLTGFWANSTDAERRADRERARKRAHRQRQAAS